MTFFIRRTTMDTARMENLVKAYASTVRMTRDTKHGKHPGMPAIVISREVGSGGRFIATELANTFGYKLYDKTIVDMIAAHGGVPAELVSKLDEHAHDSLSLFGAGLLSGPFLSSGEFCTLLKKTINELLDEGSVVIVGRGSTFLAKPKLALRVRIVAPVAMRIHNLAAYLKCSEEHAAKELMKLETDRDRFHKQLFGNTEIQAETYDLSINTATVSIEDATKMCVNAYEMVTGIKPKLVAPGATVTQDKKVITEHLEGDFQTLVLRRSDLNLGGNK